DDVAEPDDLSAFEPAPARRPSLGTELPELPGVVLALLGLALGIFPQTFFTLGALFATDQIVPEGAVRAVLRIVPFGYATNNSQWLAGILGLGRLGVGVGVLVIRWGSQRTAVTLETSGGDELTGMASDALDEPGAVWLDLAPAFTSPWIQVGGRQLIGGIDED